MTDLRLAPKAQKIVNRLNKHYDALIADGYTPHNATDKLIYQNGEINYLLINLALVGRLTPDEWEEAFKVGLAEVEE